MWHHPKYYKELRKLRNKLDQAISPEAHDGERERAPGPGLEVQIVYQDLRSLKQQATSNKRQAPSSEKKE